MRLLILVYILFLFSGCQSAWQVKPDSFKQNIDQEQKYNIYDLYTKNKGLVLVFWQSTCPCVKRYEQRVNKLYEKYNSQLEFVYMSSNSSESYAQALRAYNKRNIAIKLLRDKDGLLAKAVSAKGTPTALLINNLGDIIYMGWIDNERREGEKGRVAYLEDAIKEYLSGQEISIKTSPMFGCKIY